MYMCIYIYIYVYVYVYMYIQGKLFEEYKFIEPTIVNDFMQCNNIVFSQNDVFSTFNKLKLEKAVGLGPDGNV